MKQLAEFFSWWIWRRWRIHCPTRDVSHLFEIKEEDFRRTLFSYDEAFISPCVLNEKNCGGLRGKWIPKIAIIGIKCDGRFDGE